MYDAVRLISLLTRCLRVIVRNGHEGIETSHTLSLSYTHTHTRTHQKEIDSVIFSLQSLLAEIARQLSML